jgi:hypothetical protein
VSVDGLRRELLAVPGVAGAVVDDAAGSPRVRVVLAPGAAAAEVGAAVQRVLATHGLASRLANGAGGGGVTPEAPVTATMEVVPEPAPQPPEAAGAPLTPPAAPVPESPVGDLASLTVEESPGEILVVATATDGRRFSRRSTADGPESVAAAVVAVVGTLIDGRAPRLVAVWFSDAAGSEVVTVVVERRDGTRHAGAAVVRVGRPYAVARAVWEALRS